MSKFLKLISISLKSNFRLTNSKKKKTKVPEALIIVLFVFLGLYMMFAFAMMFFGIGIGLSEAGMGFSPIIILGYLFASIMMLFLTTFKAQAQIFHAKDLDMLMAMPISPILILFGKIAALYLTNLVIGFVFIFPANLAFFIFNGPDPAAIITAVINFFTLPCIPMAISIFLAFLTSFFSENNKIAKLISTLLTLGLLVAYIMSINKIQEFVVVIIENSDKFMEGLSKYYLPAGLLARAVQGNYFSLLMFTLLTLACFLLVVFVLSKIYFKLIQKQNSIKIKRRKYKLDGTGRSPQWIAVMKKEFSKYFSSSVYVINTIFGIALLLVFSIMTLFSSNIVDSVNEVLGDNRNFLVVMAAVILSAIISTVCTTGSSISLESKNLWVLMSSPIEPMQIFKGKIALNYILIHPALLISSILFAIGFSLTFTEWIFVYLCGFACGILVPVLGIIINLMFPKLDAVNDAQVVKQSLSAMLSMFGAIILSLPAFIIIVPLVLNGVSAIPVLIAFTVYYLILSVAAYIILKIKGSDLFYNLRA